MTLYSNEASKAPINIRAMFILWAHNRELAYRSMIFGPALLTGNDEGADVDVPDEIIGLIFKPQRYKVEMSGDGMRYEV